MADIEKAIEAVKYGIRAAELAGDRMGRSQVVLMKTNDLDNILQLLVAQEPRVMPVEEAARNAYSFYHQPDSVKPVFVQFRDETYSDEGLTPPWRGGVNQRALLKQPNSYGKDFVFWTDRPSEEQMKAVKWND